MKKNLSDADMFQKQNRLAVSRQGSDKRLQVTGRNFLLRLSKYNYSHHFLWLGRPIIQYPQDIIAMQEIIWNVKPDYIIETGIARGGSIIFYASILELLGHGKVIGIDIDIRKHNRVEIEGHKMSKRIAMIEGSSVDPLVVKKVSKIVRGSKKILVCLDSSHTHEHVLKELGQYSPFVSRGSYIVAFDTDIEFMPNSLTKNRPWRRGDNPATAVRVFLKNNKRFIVDESIDNKLVLSVAPGGYLKRIK